MQILTKIIKMEKRRNGEVGLSGDTEETQDKIDGKGTYIRRETGYKGWNKTIEQVWPEVPQELPYTPPKIIQATDVHYQSADAEDDGAAFSALCRAV